MQNLALLLLLAVTASMILTFDASVFAQETPETPSDEGMTEETPVEETPEETPVEETPEETPVEETPEETPVEETPEEVSEEGMEETMAAETVDSPLKQMISGVNPQEITCKTGQMLVFKASNWRPSCVNESSFDVLVSRGWVASSDPSQDDLTKMLDDYIVVHPPEETPEETSEEPVEETSEEPVEETVEEGTDESVEIDEDVIIEGHTQQQNYTIELREDMSMTTQ